jgi:hypothetical protein
MAGLWPAAGNAIDAVFDNPVALGSPLPAFPAWQRAVMCLRFCSYGDREDFLAILI